jgi:hypothetical protein
MRYQISYGGEGVWGRLAGLTLTSTKEKKQMGNIFSLVFKAISYLFDRKTTKLN